jgi:hypothetical protein
LQNDDIILKVSIQGEPQKLFTYCRGSFPGVLPTNAAISIVRPRSYQPHSYHNPNINFDQMSCTEKKRAELSVSEKSLRMDATEIGAARMLTDVTFNWLSGKSEAPRLSQPISIGKVALDFECGPPILDAIEAFHDLELISSFAVGAAYPQGQPRRPVMRYLPKVTTSNKAQEIALLQEFENLLARDQAAKVRELIERVAQLFKKRVRARKLKLDARVREVLGCGLGGVIFENKPVSDAMIDGYQYDEILSWLNYEERRKDKPKGNIRAWRA